MSKPGRHIEGLQTRERVLKATAELMATQGFSGTSINQISKASSTNPASIYWAFENKEGLFAAVMERAANEMFEQVQQILPQHGDMHQSIVALSELFEDGPEFLRLLLVLSLERRDTDPAILKVAQGVRRQAADLLSRIFEQVIELPQARKRKSIARRLARFTIMLLDGVFVASQIEPDETDIKQAFELIALSVTSTADALVQEAGDRSQTK